MDKIQEGDLLQLKGVDGPLYCEVVSILDNEFEVYFVEPQGEWLWAYSEEWHKVPIESWETHVPVVNRDYKSAYMELGFKALDGIHFVKLSDESKIPKNFQKVWQKSKTQQLQDVFLTFCTKFPCLSL